MGGAAASMVFRNQNEANWNDSQPEVHNSYSYLQLEVRIMKIIEDSASDVRGIMSIDELIGALGTFDPFILRQVLTLEGKGLIKKVELGFYLDIKKERLRRILDRG